MSDALQRIEAIANLAAKAGFDDLGRTARDAMKRLGYDRVHLVVVGEFNRGKSTLVNALIGEPLLPMDIVPTTAAIWTIEQGRERAAAVVRRDGRAEPIEANAAAFARLSAGGDLCQPDVRFVRVTVPRLAVGDDVVIIDTPGVNDINEQRSEVTYGFLGQADAAVFVMDASSPLTRSEAQFLQGQVLDADLRKILFVLNKFDRIDDDEAEDAVAAAAERLAEILGRPVDVVGCDAARVLSAFEVPTTSASPEQVALERTLALADPRRRAAADRWGWGRVLGGLDRLLADARSHSARDETAARQAVSLGRELRRRLIARRDLAALAARERDDLRARFERDQASQQERLDRLIGHVALHGRERLKAMTRQSLGIAVKEFIDRENMRLATMKGEFKLYAEKVLPYEIQVMVKRWFERSRPEIERFLEEVSRSVARDYHRAFGGSFGFGGALSLEQDPSAVDIAAPGVEDVSEHAALLLPVAGALAVSLLVTGPFLLVGAAAGGFLAKRIQSAQAAAVREQLVADLPAVVEAATEPLLVALAASTGRWFESFEAALRKQFRNDCAARAEEFTRAAGDSAGQAATHAETERALADLAALIPSTAGATR